MAKPRRPPAQRGASSSPTGMGVSTCCSSAAHSAPSTCVDVYKRQESQQRARRLPGHGRRVRPRHRRGWESQRAACASCRLYPSRCVLVTDGDGSLNHVPLPMVGILEHVRPRHRRGWESQLHRPIALILSVPVRPRHRRGWELSLIHI